MSGQILSLPKQQLSFYKKNKEWRKQHLDWADSKTFFNFSLVRKSVIHKKINYDLLNGKLHMTDIQLVMNPDNLQSSFIPDRIQHYPIMNSKLNVLRGEEAKRIYDFKVVVTNPTSISEIEKKKKAELVQKLQDVLSKQDLSEDEFNNELDKINDYYSYEWQDLREIRANALLNHYIKEYNIPLIFNNGFVDAMTVGEEIYQCDIVGGEPVIHKLNPLKIRIFKSGYSNRVEDADVIILEDYWNPGRIIDTYYDVLSAKDIEYIEKAPDHIGQASADKMDNIDERYGFVNYNMVGEEMSSDGFYFDPFNLFSDSISNSLLPYDLAGNIRVLRMYWKSKRAIKKVKSYDIETGEEIIKFYPETYKVNKDLGEESQTLYINEAWEGTKIGTDIYINMRPRVIQYNRLSNPSRCHFGIIGSLYNMNEARPFSLVDMMKPYAYLYDIIHDRLNKAIANNWGQIYELDLASIPIGWEVDKWLYYAKNHHLAVKDSFREGNIGSATGKLAGSFANQSRGLISADTGNYIQQNINLLEFIKMEMAEVAGISKQREGQVASRETVGGVERATLQSSYITEWLFSVHDDVKRRTLECFLETAKIALKGRSKKFQYILSDASSQIMDIDGDEFAENDYGLAVDSNPNMQKLGQQLETLAQAALQNNKLSFSTIMKLYTSSSLAEKQRFIERDEQKMQELASQSQQAEMQARAEEAQAKIDFQREEMDLKNEMNIRDNETKILIAEMNQYACEETSEDIEYSEDKKQALMEKIRQFDERLKFDKEKHEKDVELKKAALKKKTTK